MIFEVGLSIAGQICRADEHGAVDRILEKTSCPRFVVGIGSILGSIAPRRSDLNGMENAGGNGMRKHQTTLIVSPTRIVPVWTTEAYAPTRASLWRTAVFRISGSL